MRDNAIGVRAITHKSGKFSAKRFYSFRGRRKGDFCYTLISQSVLGRISQESLTVEHADGPSLECVVTGNRNGVIIPSVSCIEKTVNAGGVCPRETDK